jgi:hypothetical protein
LRVLATLAVLASVIGIAGDQRRWPAVVTAAGAAAVAIAAWFLPLPGCG